MQDPESAARASLFRSLIIYTAMLIADLTVVAVEDGPHNIGWTHPDEVNRALLDFCSRT